VWRVGEDVMHMKPEYRNNKLGNHLFNESYLALEPLLCILKEFRRMHYS